MTSGEIFIAGLLTRAISIGFVWFWVAVLNPPLVTNLVWLIAILYAEIEVNFVNVERKNKVKT